MDNENAGGDNCRCGWVPQGPDQKVVIATLLV